MRRDWTTGSSASTFDDGTQAMREWRWRCYLEHLEDLGYDLESGGAGEEELPTQLDGGVRAGGALASSALR